MQTQSTYARPQHTAGPWTIVKSFNGFVITRTWSSGFYQRMRTPPLATHEQAAAHLAGVA